MKRTPQRPTKSLREEDMVTRKAVEEKQRAGVRLRTKVRAGAKNANNGEGWGIG